MSQNGYGGGREGEGERVREEGVVVFNDSWPREARCQRCGTNRCGEVFVLIWTRGKVVELGPCIPAENSESTCLDRSPHDG